MQYLYCYLFIVNAAGLLLMLIDKQKAVKNKWRIPEKTLLTIGIIGGSLGCIIGMRLFRHKTMHLKFAIGLPIILCLQVIVLIFVCSKFKL